MTTPNDATGGHTAVPWKLDERAGCLAIYEASKDYNCLDGITDSFIHYKHGKNLDGVGWWIDPVDVANARFIVLAVNNHGKLVEALRDIKEGNYPKGKMALILAMAERGDLAGAREEMICALQKMADDALLQSIEKGSAQ